MAKLKIVTVCVYVTKLALHPSLKRSWLWLVHGMNHVQTSMYASHLTIEVCLLFEHKLLSLS